MHKFPRIMGILNVTPDSFSDGGNFFSMNQAVEHGLELIEQGADIIDIGGESTRPGSLPVSLDEEFRRVMPVIEAIHSQKPNTIISIDTCKAELARAALDCGALIINNINGTNPESIALVELAAKKNAGYIIMHIQGKPENMQQKPCYSSVVEEVFSELKQAIDTAKSLGVKEIYADYGIGFGKTVEHNLELLRHTRHFLKLGVPLLVGLSRKTFLGKILGIDNPSDRDLPTALIHALLLNEGADIIRVHNVKNISMLKVLWEQLSNG